MANETPSTNDRWSCDLDRLKEARRRKRQSGKRRNTREKNERGREGEGRAKSKHEAATPRRRGRPGKREICNREKHGPWIYGRLPQRRRVLLITDTPTEPWNIIIDLLGERLRSRIYQRLGSEFLLFARRVSWRGRDRTERRPAIDRIRPARRIHFVRRFDTSTIVQRGRLSRRRESERNVAARPRRNFADRGPRPFLERNRCIYIYTFIGG